MARWVGFATDAVAGGSSFDDLSAGLVPAATEWIPVTTAQVDPGVEQRDRNDEVRGRRSRIAPKPWKSKPSTTYSGKAYPKLLKQVVRDALGGTIATTGTAPAAITSTIQQTQSDPLPAKHMTVVREGQVDRMSGTVVNSFELNFTLEGDGTIEVNTDALYHDVDPTGSVTLPNPVYAGYLEAYTLRDVKVFLGAGAGTLVDCIAGVGITYDNGMLDDDRSRLCAGRNIVSTTLDSQVSRVWYPERHKIGVPTITGRLDFGDVRPDRELRRILATAEKITIEVSAGPITPATTPPADEVFRFVAYTHVNTGGGADPVQREGDQFSSYEFGAYLDELTATNKDVEAVFVGAAALT